MDYKELAESAFKHAKIFKMEGDLSKAAGLERYGNAITDLLARAEKAEARAEKAERERDAAVEEIPKICYYCKRRKGWKVCEDWNGSQEAETCKKWEWRGQKEE